MARYRDNEGGHAADGISIAVLEQGIELRSVTLKLGALIEDLAEGMLDLFSPCADAELAAQFMPIIGRGRQMIGMDMGLDDPFKVQMVLLDRINRVIRTAK